VFGTPTKRKGRVRGKTAGGLKEKGSPPKKGPLFVVVPVGHESKNAGAKIKEVRPYVEKNRERGVWGEGEIRGTGTDGIRGVFIGGGELRGRNEGKTWKKNRQKRGRGVGREMTRRIPLLKPGEEGEALLFFLDHLGEKSLLKMEVRMGLKKSWRFSAKEGGMKNVRVLS